MATEAVLCKVFGHFVIVMLVTLVTVANMVAIHVKGSVQMVQLVCRWAAHLLASVLQDTRALDASSKLVSDIISMFMFFISCNFGINVDN